MYLLSCKIFGLQYVGSTTDRFKIRWNNYEDNDRKLQRGEEHMQPELFEYFDSKKHNFTRILILYFCKGFYKNSA